jgi:bacterioferritin-associated ferredoxin
VYVCLCKNVNDRRIAQVVGEGARTVDDVGDACGAGTNCTGCHNEIERLIDRMAAELAEAGRAR